MFDTLHLALLFFFLMSFGSNILLIWYTRNLLTNLHFVSQNMGDLVEEILTFDEHLKSVHEMEMFYGDETLGNLIRHSGGLVDTLEDFAEIYTLFDEEAEELLTEEVPSDANAEAEEA